jgi:hypothetical protein
MDARSADRVGEGGLCLPEPERGKVWKPAQGFHNNDFRSRRGRPGASPHSRAPLSPISTLRSENSGQLLAQDRNPITEGLF